MRIFGTMVLATVLAFLSLSSSAQTPKTDAQAFIESIASQDPLSYAQAGVMARRVSGEVLVDYNSSRMLVPASNAKLITTGTVLNELGSEFKFETGLAYSGTVEDGVLKGDLYILGGGDPTLASKDSIALTADALFAKWRAVLSGAGIKRIEGNVIGDGRYFDGEKELSTWLYEDIGTYYGSGADGLSFYRNIQDFNVAAGPSVGAPLRITPNYPKLPWMEYSYNCSTGIKGSGDKLYLYVTDLAPYAQMRGTFAVDRNPKRLECSNKFGAFTCAWMFRENLVTHGVQVGGSAADIDAAGKIRTSLNPMVSGSKAAAVSSLKHLDSTYSPSIRRIAYITNQRSDNFYAEALLRILGKRKKGSAGYDASLEAEKSALRNLGLNPDKGISMADGSGLSRKNLVSPAFFCDFLKAMLGSNACEPFVKTLPQPGKGTQASRMRSESPAATARVYYKSGSMSGVRCYSGYVVPTDGGKEDTIVFSVMINNYTGPDWKIMGQIDKLIGLIAKEN